MARIRATGRFYFLLTLLVAVIGYFVWQSVPQKETNAIVTMATSTDKRLVDAVIIRDETVVSIEGLEKVVYIAREGSHVRPGDPVAELYTTSYIAKEYARLLSTRESIRDYQRGLFAESTDSTLDRLDRNVLLKALQLRNMVASHTDGNMQNLSAELADAMAERQRYMNQNLMADTKLMQLYQDEAKRLGSMDSWKSASSATEEGIVSFYFDGYESAVSADDFLRASAQTLRGIYQGDTALQAQKSKRSEQVYRIVSDEMWYVALISRDGTWAPVTGQSLSFTFSGFEDLLYTGTVLGVQRSGSDVIIQLGCSEPIGPLLYQRSGKAEVGIFTTGLSVPTKALFFQNEQPGVWVNGSFSITFIPVDILSQDRSMAIVQPMQSGALYEGQTILIY